MADFKPIRGSTRADSCYTAKKKTAVVGRGTSLNPKNQNDSKETLIADHMYMYIIFFLLCRAIINILDGGVTAGLVCCCTKIYNCNLLKSSDVRHNEQNDQSLLKL